MFGFQPVPIETDPSGYDPPPGGSCSILSSSSYGGKTTSHVITLPTGITTGDKIIIGIVHKTYTPTGFTGYSIIRTVDLNNNSSSGTLTTYLKTADGSEGSTLTLTTAGTADVAAVCYRLTCSNISGSTNYGTGTTATSSAPSSVSGNLKELLLLGFLDARKVETFPAGYTENPEVNSSGGTGSSLVISAAWKTITGSSETPGSISLDGSVDWGTIVEVFS